MKSDTTNNWIVCRVCLKQPDEEMRTIFDANDDKDLTNLILRCGGVPIKRFDHFPDKICNKCYKYLCVANSFRQTCQRSHQHLSKFIAPVDMENAVATVSQDPIEPDISLHLGDHAVTLKMEPLESTEKDGETKEIKHELNDDMIEHFQPMHVDVPGGLIDETLDDCAISDCEFLEELNDASLSEEGYEGSSLTRKTESAKKLKSTEINKKSNKPAGSKGETIIIYKPDKKRGPKPSGQGRKPRPSTKKPKDTSYICDICGNLYPSQSRLTEHIKLHKGIKPYECEICGHAFAQTQQLARHMNTHTGRRPYKCNYCPAAFADVSTRNKHHRIHTNERPYVCDVCGKTFTYTNTLKFHKMTHTGEKPHVCDICGKAFQQAYKMRLHRLVHEKKGLKVTQEEKPAGTKIELLEI